MADTLELIKIIIAILTLIVSIGTFIFTIRDRFITCKIEVTYDKNYIVVSLRNLGKQNLYIKSIAIHSNLLIHEPYNIRLVYHAPWIDDRKPQEILEDNTCLESKRSIDHYVRFDLFRKYIQSPINQDDVKIWALVESQTGRVFRSKRINIPAKLLK